MAGGGRLKKNGTIMLKLILASKSPRRIEILSSLGYKFQIIPAQGEEFVDFSLTPERIVQNVARGKAEEIFSSLSPEQKSQTVVIGMDTVVAFRGEILQKPKSDDDERRMLNELSGNVHEVWTGYCLIACGKRICGAERSSVKFNVLSNETVEAYVKSGLGMDKAGGYGVQDGYGLVEGVEGSYYNVIGFNKETMQKLLSAYELEKVN